MQLPPPQLKLFIREQIESFLKLDGKTLTTLKTLLTQPGFLTVEHWRGRRVRYTEPRRLYAFASVLFFVCLAISGHNGVHLRVIDDKPDATPKTTAPSWIDKRLEHAKTLGQAELEKRVSVAMASHLPKVMFALMPIFALLLLAAFRQARRPYLAHLTFATHAHTFLFLLLIPPLALSWLSPFAWTAISVYALFAMRRAYGLSLGATTVRFAAVSFTYIVLVASAFAALLFMTLIA